MEWERRRGRGGARACAARRHAARAHAPVACLCVPRESKPTSGNDANTTTTSTATFPAPRTPATTAQRAAAVETCMCMHARTHAQFFCSAGLARRTIMRAFYDLWPPRANGRSGRQGGMPPREQAGAPVGGKQDRHGTARHGMTTRATPPPRFPPSLPRPRSGKRTISGLPAGSIDQPTVF